MQDCQVCGRSFDPMAFQVVLPELGRGFDRIECAQSARALAGPGSRVAVAPVAAVVEPIAVAAAAPVAVAAFRPLSPHAATLGLLAAGTAAAALLWLRVLGTDPAGFPFIRGDAPQATAGETVEARITEGPGSTATPAAEPRNPRADTPRPILIGAATTRGAAGRPTTGGEPPRVARRPSDQRGGGSQGGGKHAAKGNGKGKGHQGKGLGHTKHGDSAGQHSPGHGSSQGASSSHAQGQSAGHGKSRGHGKKH